MLPKTNLHFISAMEVTDHKHYDWSYQKQNKESSTSGMLFKKYVHLEVSCFARNMYETKTATSGLCYIEYLIFLENNIVWFLKSLDVQSTDSSVELYNILSYSTFFF